MPLYKDAEECKKAIAHPPGRIISLVPSQTELLYHLGLEAEVIGITKFCIHPQAWHRTKTRIGGTKNLHIEKIKSLQPDLIIANKEENVKEQVEALAEHYPVYVTDINTLADALQMIKDVGLLTDKKGAAQLMVDDIQTVFKEFEKSKVNVKKAVYLIWKDPYMTVGGDTFISHMLHEAGFVNAFHKQARYPVVTTEDLQKVETDVLLLSSEPYPFQQKHVTELEALLPGKKILLVDGEMFSWYGSRLLGAPAYFTALQNEINTV